MAHYPLGIAYVGVGGYADAVLGGSGNRDLISIRGVFDVNAEAAGKKAAQYGCPVYRSFDEVLADPAVDAVAFTLPPHENLPHVRRAAQSGRHCFVAKPIALTVRDGRAMDEACRKAGVVLLVGHTDRRRSEARAARKILEEGTLGQVVLFEANSSHSGGWRLPPGHWRADRGRCPVVPLTMLGIHMLDTMNYLIGPATAASAVHRHTAMPADNEDVAVQIYEMAGGGVAYLGDSYVSPFSYWIRIHGTKASLYLERERLTLIRPDVPSAPVVLTPVDTNKELIEEFARAVVEHAPIETGAVPSMRALACAEAALRAAASGRREKVEEVAD